MRRRGRFDVAQSDLALQLEARVNEAPQEEELEDDRLRLIFTCCHPALPSEGQVALTLREVCGLTTEEIARAFLVTPATLAQRIVRAKAVIRDKAIAYQVPVSQELSGRLEAYFRLCTWFSTRVIQWKQQGLDWAARRSVWVDCSSTFSRNPR